MDGSGKSFAAPPSCPGIQSPYTSSVNVNVLCPSAIGGRGPTDRSIWLAGRTRTRFGHQNQRPITAMIDGVMSDRTTKVSNRRPMPIVVEPCRPLGPQPYRSLCSTRSVC